MLLTILGFSLSESGVNAVPILLVAGLKFSLVAWYFMDLRQAATWWMGGLLGLLAAVLVAVFWLGTS